MGFDGYISYAVCGNGNWESASVYRSDFAGSIFIYQAFICRRAQGV